MPPSPAPIQSARPTIAIDGQDQAALQSHLLALTIVETVDGLYRCEATFNNWGVVARRPAFLYFSRQLLEFGKTLKVSLSGTTIFEGRIMALSGGFPAGSSPTVTVRADDRLQDFRMTRRTRTFSDVRDADVMNRLAGEHGLTPQLDVAGPTHKVLAQVNQSDLAFLRDRARAIGAEIWVEGTKFCAALRARRNAGDVTLAIGGALVSFDVTADLADQRTRVRVSGWSPLDAQQLSHDADDSVIAGELNGGASGPGILRTAFGERKDAIVHTAPRTTDEARVDAESAFRARARRFVIGRGLVTPAEPRLRVGARAKVSGGGPLFSITYYVTSVRHTFDAQNGLRTEFTAESPSLGR